jgi:hypothetical protein
MDLKRLLAGSLFILVVVVGTLIVKSALLHGQKAVYLPAAANPLAGTVSQSLGNALGASGSGKSLPVLGEDYNLRNVRYFDNNVWAVASVVPTSQADTTTIVMRKTNGTYQVVLGPGTAFPGSSLQNLPIDVSGYLTSQGVIYEPAGQ